jgi:hypothetical protein
MSVNWNGNAPTISAVGTIPSPSIAWIVNVIGTPSGHDVGLEGKVTQLCKCDGAPDTLKI